MAADVLHVRLFKADGNDNVHVIYPITQDVDVELSQEYPNLPENANTLDDVLRALNPLAFGKNMVTPESIGLGNLTNDRQVKAINSDDEDTLLDHVVIFGEDGATIKDSGFTIESNVPKFAKFTDTTYPRASSSAVGVVKLSDDITSNSELEAPTMFAVNAFVEQVGELFDSIKESPEKGTFLFDDKKIKIRGLESAAYECKEYFATSDQGRKADSAIQRIKVGNVYPGNGLHDLDVQATTSENNVVTLDFVIPTGDRGSLWFTGTAITGTSTTGVAFETGITQAMANDYYLNLQSGNIYHCIFSGDEHTALWVYEGCIKGGTSSDGSGTVMESFDISAIMMIDPDEDPRVENIGSVAAPNYVISIPKARDGKDGKDGAPGKDGKDGKNGVNGTNGTNGKDGTNGTVIYSGIVIDGTDKTSKVFTGSEVENARLRDKYLNTLTGNFYECTKPGASDIAEWKFLMCIKGEKGEQGAQGEKGEPGKDGSGSGSEEGSSVTITTEEPEEDGLYFQVV